MFNWETAKYGKIWYDEDIHDLRYVETEFPAIAFNDEVSFEKTFSYEPTVSSLNDEIDFRISFDDSDDEDYTVVFDKNSFSYKIISTNDLKTDSENDNEKVMPSLPSPEPAISYTREQSRQPVMTREEDDGISVALDPQVGLGSKCTAGTKVNAAGLQLLEELQLSEG
ncbi:hypothetical protein Tco_0419168 [Tanacetum coccineum]